MQGLRGIGLTPEVVGSRVQRIVGCNIGSSFAGSTLVQTQSGGKRIDLMLQGEKVLSKDETTGEIAYKSVVGQHVSDYPERYKVTIRDFGTSDTQVLTASHNHPFFARLPESTPIAVGAEGLVYQGPIARGH